MKRIAIGQGVVEWVARRTNDYGNFGAAQGIGLQEWKGGAWVAIAGVAYAEWNGVNVVCHIASDGSKRWLNRQYLWTIFDYPFNQLGARLITACVGQGNSASRRFVEHLGFEEEARVRGAHPTGDLLVYTLRKPRCRWLALKGSQHETRLAA